MVESSIVKVLAQWNTVYDAHNEVACLMLGTGVERFDLIQTFHACKSEERKLVSSNVLKMKGYVEQLERLGYVLSQDLSVDIIMALLAATPQVMAIQGGRIQKANKKSLNAKGKGKGKARERIKVISSSLKTLNLLLKSTRLRMTPATTAKRQGIVRGIHLLTLLS
ncbi:hypothetical protein Tco_1205947 [Tanacetum coccineum]